MTKLAFILMAGLCLGCAIPYAGMWASNLWMTREREKDEKTRSPGHTPSDIPRPKVHKARGQNKHFI